MTDSFDLEALGGSRATVAVVGAAPSLETAAELERAREADVVFAASTAADVLDRRGIEVDCMVTDLDKTPIGSSVHRTQDPGRGSRSRRQRSGRSTGRSGL